MSKQNKTFTLYRILTCKESPETSPNPESGQAILDREICTLTCTLSYTIMKTLDRPVLRLESRDFPGSASTGRTPSQKISKAVAPRNTRVLFGSLCGRQEEPPSNLGDRNSSRRRLLVF